MMVSMQMKAMRERAWWGRGGKEVTPRSEWKLHRRLSSHQTFKRKVHKLSSQNHVPKAVTLRFLNGISLHEDWANRVRHTKHISFYIVCRARLHNQMYNIQLAFISKVR